MLWHLFFIHPSRKIEMNKSLILASLIAVVSLAACGKKEDSTTVVVPAPVEAPAPAVVEPAPAPVDAAPAAAEDAAKSADDAAASAAAASSDADKAKAEADAAAAAAATTPAEPAAK